MKPTARRYFFGIVFLLCVIVGSVAIHEKVWAQEIGIAQSTINTIINGIIWVYAQVLLFVAGLFIRLTMWALQFFIDLAAYNGYIDAPSVVVGWFMIRDVANMFFIVGLLVIAIGTILGREQYEWKKSLVKLVLAAIFINFSRLILGLAIDASHIVMITFLNAIQGAAGGNIIQMLQLDKILALSGNDSLVQRGDLREDVFAAAVAGFIFALVSFLTVAAYTALMLVRMLVLWMLIILSPLAFVLQAIPQTEGYAKEFWDEFTKYIIVGPLMVFFLWLAFATMGSGDINTHVTINKSADANAPQLQLSRAQPAAGISDITKWENLSAYFIAVGFLFLGLERVGSIGVRGSSIVSSVSSAGMSAARMFSGFAAGQWAAGKAVDGAESLGKLGLETTGIPHYARKKAEKIKQAYYSSWVGSRALKREGDLSAYTETTDAIKKRFVAEGNRNSLAGEDAARATIALNNEKRRGDNEQKEVEGKVRLEIINNEKKAFDSEVEKRVEKRRNEKFLKGEDYTDKDTAEIQQEVLTENADSMPALMAALAEARSKRMTGGAEGTDAKVLADIRDMDTVLQGGDKKHRLLADEKAFRDSMADASKLDSEERIDGIRKNYKRIKDAKTPEELAKARKNMDGLIQSALEQGEGNSLLGVLKDLDGSFAGTVQSAETIPQILLGLHGFNQSQLATPVQASAAEMELRKSFGGEADVRARNLGIALNTQADKTGAHQFRGQVSKGRDENGNLVNGFTRNMVSGAAGTAGSFSTGGAASGGEIQSEKEQYARQDQSIRGIKNSSALFSVGADGKAVGYASDSPDIERMLNSLSSATVSELRATHRSVFNHLSGGTAIKNNYDSAHHQFVLEPGQDVIADKLTDLIQSKRNRYREAERKNPDSADANRKLEEYIELMRKLTGQENIDLTTANSITVV